MTTEKLRVNEIDINNSPQTRIKLDAETIETYGELWDDTDNWPFREKIVLFNVGENEDGSRRLICSDGFHRYFAAVSRDKSVLANVRNGTMQEAIDYALKANHEHGLKRSRMDKRNAVDMALKMECHKDLSNRELANLCGVSKDLVADVKRCAELDKEARKEKKKKPENKPVEAEKEPEVEKPEFPPVDDTPVPNLVSGQELPEDQRKERVEILRKKITSRFGEIIRLGMEVTRTFKGADELFATDSYDENQAKITEYMQPVFGVFNELCDGKEITPLKIEKVG